MDASSEEEQETKNVFGTVSGGALDAEEKDQVRLRVSLSAFADGVIL